jgi:hypothetical protein
MIAEANVPRSPQPRKRRRFIYRHRSAAQWLAAAGPRPIGPDTAAWLARVLNAAARSNQLGDWDCAFTADLDERLERWGDRLRLSDKQLVQVTRIASRLERKGEL